MPVFYSNDPYGKDGAARQLQIAQYAGKLATGELKVCGPYRDANLGVEEYKELNRHINQIESKIKKLEDEKDVFDGWFGTRDTKDIDKELNEHTKKKNSLKLKADAAHSRYLSGLNILNAGKNRLDDLTIQQAGEVVYYWAEKSYPAVQRVFKDYGMESSAPTMQEFILEKVKRDPIHQYKYAGGMYPYKLISRVMENACSPSMRIKIPNNIRSRSLKTSSAGQSRVGQQIDSILQKNPNQGIGISIHANLLQASSDDSLHAVNIVGCRTVNGVKEYLIHNSWGSGCNSYHQSLRSKCSGGEFGFAQIQF